jgi:hypothetical protein
MNMLKRCRDGMGSKWTGSHSAREEPGILPRWRIPSHPCILLRNPLAHCLVPPPLASPTLLQPQASQPPPAEEYLLGRLAACLRLGNK